MDAQKFQVLRNKSINSVFLKRDVKYDLILPKKLTKDKLYPTIYMNDGQDFDQLDLVKILTDYYKNGGEELVFVGIHTNEDRLQEYGTSHIPDYKNRGAKAAEYMNFVISEMVPMIRSKYQSSLKASENTICGFSLGGLSAMDIAWENPHFFSNVGVFSGSFWWRDKAYGEGYEDDKDRIMHNKVKASEHKKGLRFWFECGTNDEKADRNNNGVIDSIDDTLDLIKELRLKSYTEKELTYLEVKDGEHNFNTWKMVFPDFLKWVFMH